MDHGNPRENTFFSFITEPQSPSKCLVNHKTCVYFKMRNSEVVHQKLPLLSFLFSQLLPPGQEASRTPSLCSLYHAQQTRTHAEQQQK